MVVSFKLIDSFCLAARLRTTRFGWYHDLATLSKDNTGNTMPKGAKIIPYLRIVRSPVSAIYARVHHHIWDVSFFHSGEHFLTTGATFFNSSATFLFPGATFFLLARLFFPARLFFLARLFLLARLFSLARLFFCWRDFFPLALICRPLLDLLRAQSTNMCGWASGSTDNDLDLIDQLFRYLKIQSKTIDLSTRLWGITTEFVGLIPQSLVLRSIVLGWIVIYRNILVYLVLNIAVFVN